MTYLRLGYSAKLHPAYYQTRPYSHLSDEVWSHVTAAVPDTHRLSKLTA
jgi:hypothetical protein